MPVYHFTTGPDISRSLFLSLYPSQASLLMIPSRPIVLLNTLGKLIKKIIAGRLQFDAVKYGIFHPNQLGGVAQRSTEDAGVFLTHLV